MMDKFELKDKLIEIADTLDKLTGELMSKSTTEEVGEIRSEVFSQLMKTHNMLKSKIYNIY